MKILFFSDHFRPEPSAPAAHVYERARIWVENGHKVTVITNAPNSPVGEVYPGYRNAFRSVEQMDGIRVVRVKTFIAENKGTVRRTLDYLSYAVSAFANSIREEKPDVVISTSPHIFVPLAGVLFSLLHRVPHVFEVRDLWPASIAATTDIGDSLVYRVLEALELFLYRRSRRIIAFTQSYVEEMTRRGVPRDKIDVVINGANIDLFHPKPPDNALQESLKLDGFFVVGYLGTIGLAHGLENVVYAARLLKDAPIRFLFVGEGAEKERLIHMCQESGLKNVVFVPRQEKEQMPRYWSVCSLALVHLKDDPLFRTVIPSKIFEAMAAGVPVLFAGPDGEGSAIVAERQVGVCVHSAKPNELVDAVNELMCDKERLADMARNCVESAPDFSRQKQAERTLATLLQASGRHLD